MKEFIDETTDKEGTPLDRYTLMAMQGFISSRTYSDENSGDIIQENSNGETLIIKFNDDGSITETFFGEKTIVKTITFNEDGSVEERLS